jgi:hypothetical protein
MRRLIAAAIAASFIWAALPVPSIPLLAAVETDGWKVAAAIVFRIHADARPGAFSCTAFYWRQRMLEPSGWYDSRRVAAAWYLTAGHCHRATFMRLGNDHWFRFNPAVTVQDEGIDFAAIRGLETRRVPVFPRPYTGEPQPGEVHITVGFAGHGPRTEDVRGSLRSQALTFLRRAHSGEYVYRSSSWPIGGNSGSPVLTQDGRLVGILWGYAMANQEITYVTPIAAISRYAPWLEDAR